VYSCVAALVSLIMLCHDFTMLPVSMR
jgi:hypothetical protein